MLIGSPLGSSNASKSACKLASCSSCFFLPPPAPRIRLPGANRSPVSISRLPALMVFFETPASRSEEHTSELQSRRDLVCRLLLEKKKKQQLSSIFLIQQTSHI